MPSVILGMRDGQQKLTPFKIDSAAGTAIPLATAVALQYVRVYRIFFVVAGAVTVKFADSVAGDLTGVMSLAANGAFTLDLSGQPWFESGVNATINLVPGGAVQISGAAYITQNTAQ